MSQNDKFLKRLGVPVLSKRQRDKLRGEWQAQTWDDMILSLNSYGKYIMLRPTGFGKTYTCACACNIGMQTKKDEKKVGRKLEADEIVLNNGTIIKNTKLANITNKKIIFVYVSDILKQTFDKYNTHKYKTDEHGNRVIDEHGNEVIEKKALIMHDSSDNSRIIYETYTMVAGHWGDIEYLKNQMDIENVGLIIFDEVQRMGAEKTAEALDVAIPMLEKLGIPFIGATATVERASGYDVCDKYFTYKHPDGEITHCWGEHIYTLSDAFNRGLLIPPMYRYIEEDLKRANKIRSTRNAMLRELNIKKANGEATEEDIKDIRDLQKAIIKNSSKEIHDTMIELYDCDKSLITPKETLDKASFAQCTRPEELPKYMRFLVFTPDRKSLTEYRKDKDTAEVFKGMVNTTIKDFKDAFGRYGYKVRYTVISSYNATEKKNVDLIDNYKLYQQEQKDLAKIEKSHIKSDIDVESGKAIVPQDMVIDLIFSINMLNVGYHVDNITGLVFKRWTGSNQIFYQQLGRCLSSVSDIIPVVFDFVKSIDSRGITAPLFSKVGSVKDETENADGTKTITYKNKKTTSKKIDRDKYLMDDNGDYIDPRKCNTIDAKYITAGMTTASIDDIESRCNVYQERKNSRELFEGAYKRYTSYIETDGYSLVSDVHKIMPLYEALRVEIFDRYSSKYALRDDTITRNFLAFIEYLKNKEKTVYVEYRALNNYVENKVSGSQFGSYEHEINSLLAVAKVDNNVGVDIALLINKNDIQHFKANLAVQEVLASKRFKGKSNTIVY